jgi:hypothetical protein
MTMRLVVSGALGVLAFATAYEALVAFGVIELGSLPGEGPPGEQTVALIAVLTMLVAVGLALFAALGTRVPLLPLLPPAAAAFLLARFHTFDPYYLPTLRRFSDDGMLAPELVDGIVALAVVAALLTLVHRRAGAALSAPVVLACALFAQILVGGH